MSAKLSATSREPEELAAATVRARRTRELVADQLRALVVEGDRMGGRGDVALQVRRLVEAERRITQTQAEYEQAREMGNPLQPLRDAEREAREVLRSAAMSLAVASGSWVAALDHEAVLAAEGAA